MPAWFPATEYDGLCFHVCQAFPRTSAGEGLQRSPRGGFDESVWPHFAGTASASFDAGQRSQFVVKVMDDRCNELMVVKQLSEAETES